MANSTKSPFLIKNIRLFIAFRVFFNARFYYPVFTIIFLDFGLTIEQFAILNSIWAATIVLAEVPSGALADTIGRKKLLLTTAILMMGEMFLLCFVPLGNINIIFWAFLINRILSGLAEAMASGADEAIAYDSLMEEGDEKDWPKVLSVQMRVSSFISIITMTTGAILYDPSIMNRILNLFSSGVSLTQQDTMRFPLYLTLILSILAIITVKLMQETNVKHSNSQESPTTSSLLESLKITWEAGIWITRTPFALAIILFCMSFDHVVRMIITMTSQYYRLIQIPEALFGLIGASIAILGLLVPKIAEKMASKFTATQNALTISCITILGFFGLTSFTPYFGIAPMALLFISIMLTSFFTSHYLNKITASHRRATVLSFKGLAFNLAYGGIGLLFAGLMQNLRQNTQILTPGMPPQLVENIAFETAIGWFPWYTITILFFTAIFCRILLRSSKEHKLIL